jgi:hypothetical protein
MMGFVPLQISAGRVFRLQSSAGVGVSTFTVRATALPLGATIRDLPNYPLTRLGCFAFCFPAVAWV